MQVAIRPVGGHLREWRRRLSQLDLALEAEISTKHLSFLETGRATPSREGVWSEVHGPAPRQKRRLGG
jgi:hypothetical protein